MLSTRRKWMVFALIFLGIVVSYIDRGNLSLAAQPIMRDFHLSAKRMGVLLSVFFWTYALFQIPAGYLVDRFGIRRIYAAAFTLWSLASASIALSRGPGDIVASRLFLGFAESVGPIASLVFIRHYYQARNRGLPTALYIGGQTLGPALGTILGASMIIHYGWRSLFAITGLAAIVWVPLWLAAAPHVADGKSQHRVGPAISLRSLLLEPAAWIMSAAIFFSSYFWWFVMNWMPGYLTLSRGFSMSAMGVTFSLPLFAMTATNFIAGWAADRYVAHTGQETKARIFAGTLGLVASSALFLLNVAALPILPVLVVSICGFGVASSNLWTLAQTMVAPHSVGRFIACLNTISQVAGAAAPLLTGLTLGSGSDFHTAISLAALAPILAAGSLFFLRRSIPADTSLS